MTDFEISDEASRLLDQHHELVGSSDFCDAIIDNCAVCGFAVGWPQNQHADRPSHQTTASIADVERWIRAVQS